MVLKQLLEFGSGHLRGITRQLHPLLHHHGIQRRLVHVVYNLRCPSDKFRTAPSSAWQPRTHIYSSLAKNLTGPDWRTPKTNIFNAILLLLFLNALHQHHSIHFTKHYALSWSILGLRHILCTLSTYDPGCLQNYATCDKVNSYNFSAYSRTFFSQHLRVLSQHLRLFSQQLRLLMYFEFILMYFEFVLMYFEFLRMFWGYVSSCNFWCCLTTLPTLE